MPAPAPIPHALVQRAATIARGPHTCPTCECPTFAEPPVPWTDLRDYIVRCESCERPVALRIDRSRVLRRSAAPADARRPASTADAVAELLDTRGPRAFALRVLAAAAAPLLVAAIALQFGASPLLVLALAMLAALPGAAWGPALLATAVDTLVRHADSTRATVATRFRRAPRPTATIEVLPGRWDQWQREQKLRERERAEHPDAVLRELERVLDERELRRVRALAQRGEVPSDHLDDLLRFRKTWTATA